MEGYAEAVHIDGSASSLVLDPCVEAFFNPKSVAVIGATEKPGIGRVTIANLKEKVQRFDFLFCFFPIYFIYVF